MMITGDYHHTALAVARDVGMLKPLDSVVIIDVATASQQPANPSLLSPQPVGSALSPHALASSRVSQQTLAARSACDSGHCHSHGDEQRVALTAAPVEAQCMKTQQVSWGDSLGSKAEAELTDEALVPSQPLARVKKKPKLSALQTPDEKACPNWMLLHPAQKPSRLISPGSPGPAHAKSKHPFSLLQLPSGDIANAKSVYPPQQPAMLTPPGRAPGLTFRTTAETLGPLSASEALAALAQGQLRCAVTGDAFEHLLQYPDLSVLETVLCSAVVFSRMQPHQKGQVMDLLSSRGIHQMFEGRPRHIQVCFQCCTSPPT